MSRSNKIAPDTGPATAASCRTKNTKPKQHPLAKGAKADPASKRITKKERLIALLKTKGGVTVAKISEELNWQHHTTRAALTGLRKAGLGVSVAKLDGGGVGHYSISKTVVVRK